MANQKPVDEIPFGYHLAYYSRFADDQPAFPNPSTLEISATRIAPTAVRTRGTGS